MRPRAVTVRHPRTAAISAGDRPSHSERSRTSRSRGPRRSSASCTSDSSPVVGSGEAAASCASRSWSALRRRLDRRWFASTRRAVAYNHTRADAGSSGTSSSRRQAVRKTSATASCASLAEAARHPQYATMSGPCSANSASKRFWLSLLRSVARRPPTRRRGFELHPVRVQRGRNRSTWQSGGLGQAVGERADARA